MFKSQSRSTSLPLYLSVSGSVSVCACVSASLSPCVSVSGSLSLYFSAFCLLISLLLCLYASLCLSHKTLFKKGENSKKEIAEYFRSCFNFLY